jgi:hypothetical protein
MKEKTKSLHRGGRCVEEFCDECGVELIGTDDANLCEECVLEEAETQARMINAHSWK